MEHLDLAWKCVVVALVVGTLIVGIVYASCRVAGEWSEAEREDRND